MCRTGDTKRPFRARTRSMANVSIEARICSESSCDRNQVGGVRAEKFTDTPLARSEKERDALFVASTSSSGPHARLQFLLHRLLSAPPRLFLACPPPPLKRRDETRRRVFSTPTYEPRMGKGDAKRDAKNMICERALGARRHRALVDNDGLLFSRRILRSFCVCSQTCMRGRRRRVTSSLTGFFALRCSLTYVQITISKVTENKNHTVCQFWSIY